MKISEIIEAAAYERLLPPGCPEDLKSPDGEYLHRYSCNAIEMLFGDGQVTSETPAARRWYYNTVLCADRPMFSAAEISSDCDDPQNIRFMLMLFASYLAADEGL